MKFKFLEHTADIKFQAFGNNIKEVFENSALALKKTICKLKIQEKQEKKIKAKGKDFESLLYDFLEEFLYLLDAEDFLLAKIKKIEISKSGGHMILNAIVVGDKASNYDFTNQVKAITYSDMFVKKQKDKYTAQVVLDV